MTLPSTWHIDGVLLSLFKPLSLAKQVRNNMAIQPEVKINAKKRKGSYHPVMKPVRKSSLEVVSRGGSSDGDDK